MPVLLVIRHANRIPSVPHFVVVCGLFVSTIVFHIFFYKRHDLRKTILKIECVL